MKVNDNQWGDLHMSIDTWEADSYHIFSIALPISFSSEKITLISVRSDFDCYAVVSLRYNSSILQLSGTVKLSTLITNNDFYASWLNISV